jgi:hypothetical protein
VKVNWPVCRRQLVVGLNIQALNKADPALAGAESIALSDFPRHPRYPKACAQPGQ